MLNISLLIALAFSAWLTLDERGETLIKGVTLICITVALVVANK